MTMNLDMYKEKIIVKLSRHDRLANHIPSWAYEMSREHDVFIQDMATGELVQVLDMCKNEKEVKDSVKLAIRRIKKKDHE
jgi:hypothetical protein